MTAAENDTQWAKIGNITNISFIGKDVALYGCDCHLIFLNLNTLEEKYYLANNIKRGDGVQCYVGHRTQNIFAFAEKRSDSKIFIKTYPEFETVFSLSHGEKRNYLSMVFSDRSLLITLGDLPNFQVSVWNFRTGDKIAYHDSGIITREQFIKCSLGSPIYLLQLGVNTKFLNIWDVFTCGKSSILTVHEAKIDINCSNFKATLCTTDGGLFVLDIAGCVYTILPDYRLEKVIDFTESGNKSVWFVSYKGGIVVCGPNDEIRFYRKSGTWSIVWTIKPPEEVFRLEARTEFLLGITKTSKILQITQNECKYLKQKQSCFNDFCIIYPSGQYIVVLSENHFVYCYLVETGELISCLELKGTANLLAENPKFPYIVVGFDPGYIKLISVYKPEKLNRMTEFFLTKQPINSIRFNECGTIFVAANITTGIFFIIEGLPGCQMNIVAIIETKHQIVDHILVANQECYRIFMIPVTTRCCLAGNVVLRYCVTKAGIDIKEYCFNTVNCLYNRIVASNGIFRDRIFYVVSYAGKHITEVEIKKGSNEANQLRIILNAHQIRGVYFKLNKLHALTWSYDGFIVARTSDFNRIIGLVLPHHRYIGGVKKAAIVPFEKYIISLGADGVLVCTNITNIDIDHYMFGELKNEHFSEENETLFNRRTLGFQPKGKYEGLCYLEYEAIKQKEKETLICLTERNAILDEFKAIQKELQELLTTNLEGPDNEKLELSEFNLNVKQYQDKCVKHKKLRDATETYLKNLIQAQNQISNYMLENFWSKMKTPGTAIKAIFERFEVTNFVLRPPNVNREEILKSVRHQRRIEKHLTESNSLYPWEPIAEEKLLQYLETEPDADTKDKRLTAFSSYELDQLDAEETEDDLQTKLAFSGSDMGRFIEVEDIVYLQNELKTYFQTELQWVLSKSDCYKIKEKFNEKFDTVMLQKLKEMDNIKQKNNRLRHIVSELNYFSTEKFSVTIDDPEWQQIETPELLTQVKDEEVPITPYISPSEQALLDAKAAEAERIRLLLLADDFRERALMAMMNGVLEVRWEDELRKDVPLPKCMIEKEPENFNEDDLRAVKEYEEKAQFLNSERERYKMILRGEYEKLADSVRENIKKFNGKLCDLLNLKLLMDAAISHESLRINRFKLYQQKRKLLRQKEQEIIRKIAENDDVLISIQKLLHMLLEVVHESRTYVDSFQTKDKYLERAYKKDFQDVSPVIQEQAFKLYKKRPKVNFRNLNSSTLLNELARHIMSGVSESPTLTTDCVDFIKQLDTLEQFVGIPTIIDEHTFALICKHRRARIEYEIRLKAAQTELTETETTTATFNKRLHLKKEKNVRLQAALNDIRQEVLKLLSDGDLQIVLPRGLVEIQLTGTMEDFKNAVMVCRKDVEEINAVILQFGQKKIQVLEKGMNFRRKIMKIEWDHKRLKMHIQDLQEKSIDIDGVRLTKEIQFYLKTKDKEKTIPFETEVDLIKASYENTIQDRKDKVHKMKKQINSLKQHDEAMKKQICELNVDVCELGFAKDQTLDAIQQRVIDNRMKALLKRSKLIQQVQDNHHQILVLQTELELLRLKTFPTLKYKEV